MYTADIDPICKMHVDEKTQFKSIYKNKEYFFCSETCKKKFDELDKNVIRVRRSLKDKERISFGRLKREIIDPGICTLCGACVASCEVLSVINRKPALNGQCTACGVCYNQCPRTITTESSLIGSVQDVFSAKSAIPEVKGQNGGAVTSMLLYAFEEGLIDSAVVTVKSAEEPWRPMPIVAQTREDILRSAGSIYVHSLTMEALMTAIKRGSRSIGFVGPSCNIDAVHKMQNSPYGLLHMFMRVNILKIGLFCMDTFNYEGLKNFLEEKEIQLSTVLEMKIRKGKIIVRAESEHIFPLSDLDVYRNGSCTVCTDLTAEKSDLSFGGVGSKEGYTTVLARTGLGLELFHDAEDRGYIKIEPLGGKGLDNVLHEGKAKKVQMYMIKKRGALHIK
ncbi:MAG: Coenzyme F420 hydrogenase/dehydrogenase, beta subunit C-terminal domain [Candidatus Methanoperedens sp.]|nr:Coenzyme F420 hydrogenase/dehydrogenase, beta subunit C-terminal domain [Candidatus Methanoperedens sp.]MCZ7360429.1 Coenzyme F420 hydrogenase/dehydrogenase, beta subunit C-terminal domain [Candidatus Methanoperedens sp.]HLB69848.1 Coenzyme F420 hydrogenase/dehydrogenase, beta subunit C-terminal domain [Candidatus Methanoperedens sp.]